jgi:glycosyltransferase involved in cell wall biosynthesis
LRRLLGDEALRARMGHAARDRARTLSWSALSGRLMAFYRALVEGR